jgi:ribonucleoside-triphosphate reductase
MAEDVQNQNANVDEHSFDGRMGEASSFVNKKIALDGYMSRKSRKNHLNNEVYIHDLDAYVSGKHNCLTEPIDLLFAKGFVTRQADVRSPGSVATALQLLAVVFQLQSQDQFGGVAAGHLDWSLVPYVRLSFYKHFMVGLKFVENMDNDAIAKFKKEFFSLPNDDDFKFLEEDTIDKRKHISIDNKIYKSHEKAYDYALSMLKDEVFQSVEAMYSNLNTLQSRSGCQLPFTSLNYGTCTKTEGRLVIKALLEGSLDGTGKFHKTPIFPCGIFQLMKGVNRCPGEPNYDLYKLALKSTSQRLYPNYANCDWTTNAGYDKEDPRTYFATMGCRTYNGKDINAEEGCNPQTKDGRGNLAPVTIILPTIAMEAKTSVKDGENVVDKFMKLLDKKIHEAKDMLRERYDWLCKQSPLSAKFMWKNNTMCGYIPEQGIESALRHGTLAIGQLGLAECLQALIGTDHTTEEGMQLAKRIEGLYQKRCQEFKESERLNYGVYYTPAENLCYTAMKKFREKYGVIPNVSDRDYFTNSMHVPVWKNMTPFEKIDIESQLTGYSNAGCITYVELPSTTKNNLEALETIVNYAMDKDIPYFAINVPNDTCNECGYTDEINDKCPMCGSTNISRLRRVTGYLTGDYKTAFNWGKQKETQDRVKHIKEF